jgi:hypothetical protein
MVRLWALSLMRLSTVSLLLVKTYVRDEEENHGN